jgi:acetyl esterase/lipase
MLRRALPVLVALSAAVAPAFAQSSSPAAHVSTADFSVNLGSRYAVVPNVTYLTATGYESKLDVYRRRDVNTPQPTLVFFHGGGWVAGTKEAAVMSLMPWMEMGWNVVNVEYRMARVATAPGAVEDVLCALRHVVAQAKNYNVDTAKIVVSGESAGGHLALAAGMTPTSAGFTSLCAGGGFASSENAVPKVAAIVNWFGISDVHDMLDGPNARSYAVQWVGSGKGREDVAKSVSPITYVRSGLPPTLHIHGDADPIVPYSHSTKIHEAMTKAGVKSELFTVPGGGHGNFKPEERLKIYAKIREFLSKNGL